MNPEDYAQHITEQFLKERLGSNMVPSEVELAYAQYVKTLRHFRKKYKMGPTADNFKEYKKDHDDSHKRRDDLYKKLSKYDDADVKEYLKILEKHYMGKIK